MSQLSQEQINVDLFNEVKRLQAENRKYRDIILKLKEAYENSSEELDVVLYATFSNEPDESDSY